MTEKKPGSRRHRVENINARRDPGALHEGKLLIQLRVFCKRGHSETPELLGVFERSTNDLPQWRAMERDYWWMRPVNGNELPVDAVRHNAGIPKLRAVCGQCGFDWQRQPGWIADKLDAAWEPNVRRVIVEYV